MVQSCWISTIKGDTRAFCRHWILRLKIKQTIFGGQKDDTPFVFDLQIAVQDEDGEWSEHTVKIDDFHHTFRLQSASKPQQIVIDPNCIAVTEITFDPGLEMNKRLLNESPYWHGRLRAGKKLGQNGNLIVPQSH